MRKQQGSTEIPLNLFISYAHEDEPLLRQLEVCLSPMRQQGLIDDWHDRLILAGDEWERDIDKHLEAASIILLLISPDFLASYDKEMQRALECHKCEEARVIPVIVRPCDWEHSPFAHLQCLPRNKKPIMTWKNQDEAFDAIAQELRRIIAQQQFPCPVLSDMQRQNRARLLKRVRATWIEGLLEHSLHQAAWIGLHLQEQPDALDNPWQFQVQELDRDPHPLPVGTSIVEVYDEADGELLILGEPGSGKTTLLLQLARTLLDRAEADEHLPLPVIFNLSSWAQKRQSLTEWFISELWTKYQVPHQVGQSLVQANRILPLLDGLDEVAEEARVVCVQAIPAYYHPIRNLAERPLVLCCRSQEYEQISWPLPLSRAVSILPLTREQIDSYLSIGQEQLEDLRQALHQDAELYLLAGRPLMLSIFTLAYQRGITKDFPLVSLEASAGFAPLQKLDEKE
jgi:GTPase SAR1 family protein